MASAGRVNRGAISMVTGKKKVEPKPVPEAPSSTPVVELAIDHNFVIKTIHGDIVIMCTSRGVAIKAVDRTSESGGRITFGKDTK